jgi:sterol desaturase/sphingolipid hydroxylase (fatty acid hydroxylase superfamily)
MELKYIQVIILAVVFGLQFLLEHLHPEQKEVNDWKNEQFHIKIGLLNFVLAALPAAFFVPWMHTIEQWGFGLLNQYHVPAAARLGVSILVLDFWMYAWHRLNHTVPFLWRFHRFHHRDKKMNSTTALRFHFIELLLSYPGKAIACFVFGISYTHLVIYEIFFFIAVVIHHSNISISGRTDAIYRILFASPLLHRIHHSVKWEETNSNFGALFSFWDTLFRSRRNKASGPVVFGVEE